jgi:hypothetical protein
MLHSGHLRVHHVVKIAVIAATVLTSVVEAAEPWAKDAPVIFNSGKPLLGCDCTLSVLCTLHANVCCVWLPCTLGVGRVCLQRRLLVSHASCPTSSTSCCRY